MLTIADRSSCARQHIIWMLCVAILSRFEKIRAREEKKKFSFLFASSGLLCRSSAEKLRHDTQRSEINTRAKNYLVTLRLSSFLFFHHRWVFCVLCVHRPRHRHFMWMPPSIRTNRVLIFHLSLTSGLHTAAQRIIIAKCWTNKLWTSKREREASSKELNLLVDFHGSGRLMHDGEHFFYQFTYQDIIEAYDFLLSVRSFTLSCLPEMLPPPLSCGPIVGK